MYGYGLRNWGKDIPHKMPKDTQLLSDRLRIQIQADGFAPESFTNAVWFNS